FSRDWSSDVCSSDLGGRGSGGRLPQPLQASRCLSRPGGERGHHRGRGRVRALHERPCEASRGLLAHHHSRERGGMKQLADLTRWNRAGLSRFRYLDGNAAVWLEELRIGMLTQYLRGIPVEERLDRKSVE